MEIKYGKLVPTPILFSLLVTDVLGYVIVLLHWHETDGGMCTCGPVDMDRIVLHYAFFLLQPHSLSLPFVCTRPRYMKLGSPELVLWHSVLNVYYSPLHCAHAVALALITNLRIALLEQTKLQIVQLWMSFNGRLLETLGHF